MTASLIARDVTVAFGPRVVLDRISCTVAPGHRIGVVAPNGTGKTTLLEVLAGLRLPDSGSVTRTPPTATVGYLPQQRERPPGETVRVHLARRTGVAAAEAALDTAAEALGRGEAGADDAYDVALTQYL
ncbi:MAG: ATP-binding cassette domain-containing protein, partial [Actinomycetota bacterium]